MSSTESELLRIEGVQLYLLDGKESVRMGTGDLVLILNVQAHSPLATLVAQVAEFQWPIGKDGPVLKIGKLRYTFAIPWLLYGVILPDSTSNELVQRLESKLREYCTFEECSGIGNLAGTFLVQRLESKLGKYGTFEECSEIANAAGAKDLRLWPSADCSMEGMSDGARYFTSVHEDVESRSSRLVQKVRSGSTAAANRIIMGGEWASWGIPESVACVMGRKVTVAEMSLRMQKRVAQARCMSLVAKLVSKRVLKGAISASGHVVNFLGTAIGEAPPVRAYMSSDARREVAMASVDALAKVVEAVQTAGKSLAQATGSVGTGIVQQKFGDQAGRAAEDSMGAMDNMVNSMWTLNKVGLNMLWRDTTAGGALNANRSTTRSPSGLSDTSLQSFRQTASSAVSPKSGAATASSPPPHPSSSPNLMSISPPPTTSSQQPEGMVLYPAQLLPGGHSVHQPPASPMYAAVPPPPNSFVLHHPNSPFQQYTHLGATPQVSQILRCFDISDENKAIAAMHSKTILDKEIGDHQKNCEAESPDKNSFFVFERHDNTRHANCASSSLQPSMVLDLFTVQAASKFGLGVEDQNHFVKRSSNEDTGLFRKDLEVTWINQLCEKVRKHRKELTIDSVQKILDGGCSGAVHVNPNMSNPDETSQSRSGKSTLVSAERGTKEMGTKDCRTNGKSKLLHALQGARTEYEEEELKLNATQKFLVVEVHLSDLQCKFYDESGEEKICSDDSILEECFIKPTMTVEFFCDEFVNPDEEFVKRINVVLDVDYQLNGSVEEIDTFGWYQNDFLLSFNCEQSQAILLDQNIVSPVINVNTEFTAIRGGSSSSSQGSSWDINAKAGMRAIAQAGGGRTTTDGLVQESNGSDRIVETSQQSCLENAPDFTISRKSVGNKMVYKTALRGELRPDFDFDAMWNLPARCKYEATGLFSSVNVRVEGKWELHGKEYRWHEFVAQKELRKYSRNRDELPQVIAGSRRKKQRLNFRRNLSQP